MYFGEEYGLSIVSKKGKGTIVEIRIPALFSAGEKLKDEEAPRENKNEPEKEDNQ